MANINKMCVLFCRFVVVFDIYIYIYAKGFVSGSAIWSFDKTACIDIFDLFKFSLKCKYLTFLYLVLGPILGMVALVISAALSSNNLQCTLVHALSLSISCSTISSIRLIDVITILSPSLIAIKPDSVVLLAISVWFRCPGHQTPHIHYYITCSRILSVDLSKCVLSALQFPQNLHAP